MKNKNRMSMLIVTIGLLLFTGCVQSPEVVIIKKSNSTSGVYLSGVDSNIYYHLFTTNESVAYLNFSDVNGTFNYQVMT